MPAQSMEASTIDGAPGGAAVAAGESRVTTFSCRALDIGVATVLLVVLAPLFLAIMLTIRLDSRGRPIFRQERVGHRRRPFTIAKFRTMTANADADPHKTFVLRLINADGEVERTAERPLFKLRADHRVTRVGRFLRKSSLDELPQLWNVLRGDMSLVGPRPPIRYEVDHYPPHWFTRFAVKPGMTGLWQVSGRSALSLEEMIALDVEYVRRRSFRLNVWILVRTLPAVLFAPAAA